MIIDHGRVRGRRHAGRADGRRARPTRSASARRPASTPPRWPPPSGGAPSTEERPATTGSAAERHAGHRGRPHRLAGRAGPAPGRPAGRPPVPGGRLPAPHRTAASPSRRDPSRPSGAGSAPAGRRDRAGRGCGRCAAQTRAELTMTLRRGESVLLTLGIPVGAARLLLARSTCCPTGDRATRRLPGPGHPGPGRHVDGHGRASASPPASSGSTACSSGWAPPPSAGRALLAAKIAAIVRRRGGPGRRARRRGARSWAGARDGDAGAGRSARPCCSPPSPSPARPAAWPARSGRGQPGRGQRPLPGAAPARRHGHPAGQAARLAADVARALPGRRPVRALHGTLGRRPPSRPGLDRAGRLGGGRPGGGRAHLPLGVTAAGSRRTSREMANIDRIGAVAVAAGLILAVCSSGGSKAAGTSTSTSLPRRHTVAVSPSSLLLGAAELAGYSATPNRLRRPSRVGPISATRR